MPSRSAPTRRLVSLERALSKLGLASRTEARRLIEAGRVAVNGKAVGNPRLRICIGRDRITVDGAATEPKANRHFAANKPRGLVTTARDEQGRATVYDCLHGADGQWLAPVGRLDKASEGLIFFSNDTAWAQRILDPSSDLPKVYHVQVRRHLTDPELEQLRSGITLEDGTRARVDQATVLRAGRVNCWLEVTLHGGLNRQIRRMLAAIGAEVLRLVRVSIGPVKLGDLPKGHSRPLTAAELEAIEKALARRGGRP